jgi:hypothetical protein
MGDQSSMSDSSEKRVFSLPEEMSGWRGDRPPRAQSPPCPNACEDKEFYPRESLFG